MSVILHEWIDDGGCLYGKVVLILTEKKMTIVNSEEEDDGDDSDYGNSDARAATKCLITVL